MLPRISKLEFEITDKNENKLGTSFLFDFNNGDFILRDGMLIETTDVQALKVWIEKIIRTEKHRYKIYEGTGYGIEIENLIGKVLPNDYMSSEISRQLKEALERHPLIRNVGDIQIQRDDDRFNIVFRVNLFDENTFDQEVIL